VRRAEKKEAGENRAAGWGKGLYNGIGERDIVGDGPGQCTAEGRKSGFSQRGGKGAAGGREAVRGVTGEAGGGKVKVIAAVEG